jgi:hypothetical protein
VGTLVGGTVGLALTVGGLAGTAVAGTAVGGTAAGGVVVLGKTGDGSTVGAGPL